MINFTQQEKEQFLIKSGFIIDTVMGFTDTDLGVENFPVRVASKGFGEFMDWADYMDTLKGKYYANIQAEYGIDTVFEREFKKKLLEL